MAPIAPIAPISRRRSTSSESDESFADEPTSKRRRVGASISPPVRPEENLVTNILKIPLFDDQPRQLLLRSVALALEHVGFTGAQDEALEAICAEVDTYVEHLLAQVTSSMLNARRSQPTPLDFKYAFARFSLPLASIKPHLEPPVPASKLHLQLEYLPEQKLDDDSTVILLGEDLSGEPDKKSKPYVPNRFPSFPSKHTYKWSEKPPARETDPRKIREQAAKEARHGEEALRHIHNIEKAAKEKSVKKAAGKDPKSKERHEMWENTMEALLAERRHSQLRKANEGEDEDRSMVVNSEQQYWRKGTFAKKNSPADLMDED